MKITRHSLKNSALSTTVAALIFSITCSSTQASKPTSHRLRHSSNPVYLQKQNPSPIGLFGISRLEARVSMRILVVKGG